MNTMLAAAKAAKTQIASLTTEQKDNALLAMADALLFHQEQILAANALDLEAAKGTVSNVMLDRLLLTSQRIESMAEGIRQEDFAKAMGVSRQTISSLENGRYNPSILLAHKIAKYFDMTIEEVFLFEEE